MVHPEKGPRGQTRFSSCSRSPGTGVPWEGLFGQSSGVLKEAPGEGLHVSGFCRIAVSLLVYYKIDAYY